jgi:hypothetical protein
MKNRSVLLILLLAVAVTAQTAEEEAEEIAGSENVQAVEITEPQAEAPVSVSEEASYDGSVSEDAGYDGDELVSEDADGNGEEVVKADEPQDDVSAHTLEEFDDVDVETASVDENAVDKDTVIETSGADINDEPYDDSMQRASGVNLRVKLGIESGYSHNNMNTSTGYRAFTSYNDRAGFLIGVPILVSFCDQFALGTGLRYVQKNYTFERDFLGGTRIYSDYTNSFLQVPIYADFSVGMKDWRVFFDLGATLGLWLHSHRKGEWMGTSEDLFNPARQIERFNESVQFDSRRDNRFESALFAGFGFRYHLSPASPFISVQYHYGLTDLQKNYMIEQVARYNNTVTVQAGFLLGGLR